MDAITITLNALAILGFALAIWQTREAIRQNRQTIEQAKHLDVIRESLSTRYLEQFPHFVPRVVEVIQSAERNLLIVCDYPCYALFSSYSMWLSYEAAIKQAANRGVIVSISCLTADRRREVLREQFGITACTSDKWKSDTGVQGLLKAFLRREAPDGDVANIRFSEFEELLEAAHTITMKHSFRGVQLKEVASVLPIYFWIADDVQAVFSIPSWTNHDREQGFITSDNKLILALRKIAGRVSNVA